MDLEKNAGNLLIPLLDGMVFAVRMKLHEYHGGHRTLRSKFAGFASDRQVAVHARRAKRVNQPAWEISSKMSEQPLNRIPGNRGSRNEDVSQTRIPVVVVVALLLTALFLGGWAGVPVRNQGRSLASGDNAENSKGQAALPARSRPVVKSPADRISPGRHPRVSTGHANGDGRPITVSCGTCHATREPNFDNARAEDLDEFHRGLKFAHGNLRCLACHDPSNYDRLRLADGSGVPFEDVMQLCGQCHAIQARDFANGVHGGMNGYWDTSRGDRIRHNCTDCHDPHAPPLPKMLPTFKPRDRFLSPGDHHDGGNHNEP